MRDPHQAARGGSDSEGGEQGAVLVEVAGHGQMISTPPRATGFIVPGSAAKPNFSSCDRVEARRLLKPPGGLVSGAHRRERGLQVLEECFRYGAGGGIRPPAHSPPHTRRPPVGTFEIVIVEWFNRTRGFGFLTRGEGTEHFESTWRQCGATAFVEFQTQRHMLRVSVADRRDLWPPKCARSTGPASSRRIDKSHRRPWLDGRLPGLG